MNTSDKIKAVKDFLKAAFADMVPGAPETAGADTLKDYITESGATVKIDALQVGGKVFDVDGTTPVTSGFSLSDGTVVTVDESGTITAVVVPSPVEAAAPVIPALPAPPNYDARFEALEKTTAELMATIGKFNLAVATFSTDMVTKLQLQQTNEAITKTLEIVEQFAAAPSGDPVTPPAGASDKPNKADLRESFAKNIAARKTATA